VSIDPRAVAGLTPRRSVVAPIEQSRSGPAPKASQGRSDKHRKLGAGKVAIRAYVRPMLAADNQPCLFQVRQPAVPQAGTGQYLAEVLARTGRP